MGSVTCGPNQLRSQSAPVSVVGALHQVVAGVGAVEVPDVVQQRGREEGIGRVRRAGERRGLQHVFGLADRFAEVVLCALAREEIGDDRDRVGPASVGRVHGPSSSVARVLARPSRSA
jgi:hypothetical protein